NLPCLPMGPDANAQLLDIARVLLAEDDEKLPETLLHRVLQATGAQRGFIAVRQGESFEQKFAVRFDRASSDADRRFSRGLVRQAIETRAIVRSSPSVEQSVQAS